jgi:hypothetical protein
MKSRKLFVVAYEFPPLNVGGAQRPLKFVKYLSDFGFEPVVFSLSPDSYSSVYEDWNLDQATTSELPDQVEVIRVGSDDILKRNRGRISSFLSTWFSLLPMEGRGWQAQFESEFDKALKEVLPVAVLVTAPPFSVIPSALKMADKHNLPLVLDMRDAWSGWNMTPYGSYFHYLLTVALEKSFFKKA